uniref:Mitochondrial import inner membrane translocase subunit n=2 Tax=Echinococcus granulosus TaxID=6210 RepID=A0A068WU95_ECHGR|nr:Mitochondrial inner membrane translocase complex Tim8 9:10:13 zinc finger [Echinococcus granulosus]
MIMTPGSVWAADSGVLVARGSCCAHAGAMAMDKEMTDYLNQLQIKETSDLYVQCSTVCFSRCVMNFTARKLNDKELDCIEKCTQKFAKMNQRLTIRLFELNRDELAKQQQQQ